FNYPGQGGWLMEHVGTQVGDVNPCYASMPNASVGYGIIIASVAATSARQAVIPGSFTLSPADVRVNSWPTAASRYPSGHKGPPYRPSINLILYIGCMLIVAVFQHSSRMEAAYGLAINLTFITTTILMCVFLLRVHISKIWIVIFGVFYFTIEVVF